MSKHFFRNIIRKLGLRYFPELRDIQYDGNRDYNLRCNIWESDISKKAYLFPLYQVSQSTIGDYTYIARGCAISMTEIGKFCSIGPNFLCGWGIHPINGISTSPMFYSTKRQNGSTLSSEDKIIERKPIRIGNDVFIGANVTILDGVTIGDGAVIGAGTVVYKDIPPYAIAVGSPFQIKRYRFDEETIKKLLKIRWWEFDEEQLKDVEHYFFDVNKFVSKYDNNE